MINYKVGDQIPVHEFLNQGNTVVMNKQDFHDNCPDGPSTHIEVEG